MPRRPVKQPNASSYWDEVFEPVVSSERKGSLLLWILLGSQGNHRLVIPFSFTLANCVSEPRTLQICSRDKLPLQLKEQAVTGDD